MKSQLHSRSFRCSFAVLTFAVLTMAVGLNFATITPAQAASNCVFVTASKKMVLQGPCSTDSTIIIPDGHSLIGQGFKITAIDPPVGNFIGPIVRSGGKSANVYDLFLRTNLADTCNDEANKVIGILFHNAKGNISGVNVTINKANGASVCQEGTAIQAQTLPFNPRGAFNKVTIKNNTLNYNQLAGIVLMGNVNARVETTLIKNLGGFASSQRGIYIAGGAKFYVLNNEILRHQHNPLNDDPSYGILLNGAGAGSMQGNILNYNDIAIRIAGGTRITARSNIVRSSTWDGILVDDMNGLTTTAITLLTNDSGKNGTNGIRLHSAFGLLTKNIVKSNLTERNVGNGIYSEGTLNKIQANTSSLNDALDIADAGSGNLYQRNVCTTSSGPPVDCPPLP